MLGTVGVIAFVIVDVGPDIDETAASILVAAVFGVATVLQLRQTQRRQHTIGLLTNFQSTESLNAADMWMAQRIATRLPIDDDLSPDDRRHVIAMLDYYEFLASLALRGFIDVPLLVELRCGAMRRSLHICWDYIMRCREEIGAELYRSLEIFVREHARHSPADGPDNFPLPAA